MTLPYARRIALVELMPYDPDLPGITTLRYSSERRFVTSATDTPANTIYEARLVDAGTLSIDVIPCFSGGLPSYGYGQIVLANADGSLDDLRKMAFSGQKATLRVGGEGGAYPAGFSPVFTAVMEQPEFNQKTVIIRLSSAMALTDQPACQNVYGGTGGLDGSADLEGKAQPRIYGAVFNFAPPQVDTANLIFHAADLVGTALASSSLTFVDAVYDSGVAITAGADYATLVALQTVAPAAGTYRMYQDHTGTWFRLGTTPDGVVTCDLHKEISGSRSSACELFSLISDISFDAGAVWGTSALGTLTSGMTSEAGIAIADTTTTYAQAAGQVAQGIYGFVFASDDQFWRLGQLEDPTALTSYSATRAVRQGDMLGTPTRLGDPNDLTHGVPAWRLVYLYGKNYTVQTTGLASGVTQARRNYLKAEYRSIVLDDATIKTAYPNAPVITVTGLLTDPTEAATEAARIWALIQTRRTWITLKARISPRISGSGGWAVPGDPINIDYSRLGLTGVLGLVVSAESDARRRIVTMTVYIHQDAA